MSFVCQAVVWFTISVSQPGGIRRSIVWTWSSVSVQVDCELALSAGRHFPRPLFPPDTSSTPRCCSDLLLLSALDQVSFEQTRLRWSSKFYCWQFSVLGTDLSCFVLGFTEHLGGKIIEYFHANLIFVEAKWKTRQSGRPPVHFCWNISSHFCAVFQKMFWSICAHVKLISVAGSLVDVASCCHCVQKQM